jgi:hypothetical protein
MLAYFAVVAYQRVYMPQYFHTTQIISSNFVIYFRILKMDRALLTTNVHMPLNARTHGAVCDAAKGDNYQHLL